MTHCWSFGGKRSEEDGTGGQNILEITSGCTEDYNVSTMYLASLGGTHLQLPLDVIIDTFRVGHVFEHDIADLENGFTEAYLEQLDCTDLISAVPRSCYAPPLPRRSLSPQVTSQRGGLAAL